MRKSAKKQKLQFGSLISALYDEVARITTNKSLQAGLVYLALQDLRRLNKSLPSLQR